MSGSFVASEEELVLVAQIYEYAGCSRPGVISGETAVDIFAASVDLPPIILSTIWNIADEDKKGHLSERGLAIALRLIGWAQNGREVNISNVTIPGPLAKVKGIPNGTSDRGGHPTTWPPFTPQDKAAFDKTFEENGPINGFLDGDRVRDFFLHSNLPPQDLWQIWNLADTQKKGALDSNDFALGMYLIQAALQGKLSSIPSVLPSQVYEQIFGTPTQNIATLVSPPRQIESPPHSPLAVSPPKSPTLYKIEKKYQPRDVIPHHDWDVSLSEKAICDQHFDTLDPQKNGFVEGDVVAKFMLGFKLPPEDLAHIWDLADLHDNNKLTREGFAVAMHLIQQRLSGTDLPYTLPLSLIPPSLRTKPLVDTPHLPQSLQLPQPPPKELTASRPETLIRTQTEPRPRRAPPLPPKPMTSHSGTRQRRSLSLAAPSTHQALQLTDEPRPPTVTLDQYRNLERENSFLTSKIEELLAQLEVQHSIQAKADDLAQENESLAAKIHEMEQITSQLLQANETHPVAEDLTRQNKRLSRRIADMEQVRSQLAETTRRLDLSTQENKDLSARLREVREAGEAASARALEEADSLKAKMKRLEQDNTQLRARAEEMGRSISRSDPSNGTAHVRELTILMGDVTRENEELKKQLRQIQQSTTQYLLSPDANHAATDELRRENQHLAVKVEELEQFTKQLQTSSDDNVLQRVLQDVTHENEALKGRLREMRHEITQVQSSSRAGDLQREISNLKAEVQRLQIEVQNTPPPHAHEDPSIPPPAYNDPF